MRSYGPRVDRDTGALHARVSQAADYTRVTDLWRRRVGNGSITCTLIRAHAPGHRRLVQLVAEYSDAGVETHHVVQCTDELDEARQLERLEQLMLTASIRPTGEP